MIKRILSVLIIITIITCGTISCKACGIYENFCYYIASLSKDYIKEEVSNAVKKISIPDVTKPIKDVEKVIKPTTAKRIQIKDPYIKNNLGTFSLTFYVPDAQWGYNTATGETPVHLGTCAVDPKVIPYGSVIKIVGNNGQTIILRANDCGGGIKGNKIDIFWDTAIASVSDGYKWMGSFGTIHAVYLLEE